MTRPCIPASGVQCSKSSGGKGMEWQVESTMEACDINYIFFSHLIQWQLFIMICHL